MNIHTKNRLLVMHLTAVRLRRCRSILNTHVQELLLVKIGIPREIKKHEYRIAMTPTGVHELARGHQVFVESGAGRGSSFDDADYLRVGVTLMESADDVWGAAEVAAPESIHTMTRAAQRRARSNPTFVATAVAEGMDA